MSRTKLMLILLGFCVVFGGGYGTYLWFQEGISQGAGPQIGAMFSLILAVGAITWYVYRSEK